MAPVPQVAVLALDLDLAPDPATLVGVAVGTSALAPAPPLWRPLPPPLWRPPPLFSPRTTSRDRGARPPIFIDILSEDDVQEEEVISQEVSLHAVFEEAEEVLQEDEFVW